MACLHLVNSERALAECLTVAADTDSVLLLAKAAGLALSEVDRPLMVLQDDLPSGTHLVDSVTPIDYAEFVALAAEHQPIITWR